MSSWHIKYQTVLRVTLALITTAFSLLAIAVGGVGDTVSWLRERTGKPVRLTFSLLEYP